MKITVTPEDIHNGRRSDPDLCPVGWALRRAEVPYEGVMGNALLIADPRGGLDFLPLPVEVAQWILDYDRGRPVEPFTFELPFSSQARDCSSLTA